MSMPGTTEGQLIQKLQAWTKNGGELDLALPRDFRVATARLADAVCDALASNNVLAGDGVLSPLHELVAFLQSADGPDAVRVFRTRGLPALRTILQHQRAKLGGSQGEAVARVPIGSDLLFATKIVALYGETPDAALIVDMARTPHLRDEYLWTVVFDVVAERHPAAVEICDGLREPLPGGFVGVAYLDFANSLSRDGRLSTHPFASSEGARRLHEYVNNSNAEDSHAISAIAAAPYLPPEVGESLLTAADAIAEPTVRMEVAWAREKLGDRLGRATLAGFCSDPRFGMRAMRYMEELGLSGEIPPAARAPEFVAQAEMCDWLAHPNEFGSPPDRVATFDTRILLWPPTNDRRQIWLIKYEYDPSNERQEAESGVGLVGSQTFALFGETTTDLSPEDVYGLHCCFELELNSDRRAPKTRSAAIGRMLLAKHNRGF